MVEHTTRLARALRQSRSGFRRSWRENRQPPVLAWAWLIAVLYVAFWILGTASSLLQDIVSRDLLIALPVQSFWPHTAPHGAARVVGGGFSAADVTVRGLGWDVRGWLIGGHLLMGVANVTVGLSVRRLTVRL